MSGGQATLNIVLRQLLALVIVLSTLLPIAFSWGSKVAAASGDTAPDQGMFRLRKGRENNGNGNNLKIAFKIYYPKSQYITVPTDAKLTLTKQPNSDDDGCDDNDASSYRIKLNGGQDKTSCESPLQFNLSFHDGGDTEGLSQFWIADAAVTLSVTPKNGHGSDPEYFTYKFKASVNGTDSKIGYEQVDPNQGGTTFNGYSVWGSEGYSILFGPPPVSCSDLGVRLERSIGAWDTGAKVSLFVKEDDGSYSNITADTTNRTGWQNNNQTIGTGDNTKLQAGAGNLGKSTAKYKFEPQRKYKLVIDNPGQAHDTLVPIWPFESIYGSYQAQCNPSPVITNTYSFLKLINGDIMTGGNLSTYAKSAGYSSSNLAAFVSGTIDQFTTSSNGANGAIPSTITAANRTKLTFADNGGWGGVFGQSYSVPSEFWQQAAAAPHTAGLTTYDQNTCTTNGIAHVNGDVYVTGNLASFPNPAFDTIKLCGVIATGNIFIDPSITRLYGIYAAQQNLYDCANGAPPTPNFVVSNCRNTLTVHGSLLANWRVYVTRIPDSTDGEVVTYSPELWLQDISGTGPPNPASGYDAITSLPPIL